VLLARTDGNDQAAIAGKQAAERVGFFLHVEDFDAACADGICGRAVPHRTAHPTLRPVAVFAGIAGNKWDLIGPAS